jgi:hypothetical protein
MGNQVQLWQARDGSMWRTKEDMQAHELALDRDIRVEAWLDGREPWGRGGRTRARNILVSFLEETSGDPAVRETVIGQRVELGV